jgi:hypothetical protein
MPDLLNCLVTYEFELNDAAANPTTPALIPPSALPDTADIAGFVMPKAGAVVGITAQCPNASGDSVTVTIAKNNVQMDSVSVQTTNAAPNAYAIFGKDQSAGALQFAAGDVIAVKYLTATGGSYAVKDLLVELIVQFGLSE